MENENVNNTKWPLLRDHLNNVCKWSLGKNGCKYLKRTGMELYCAKINPESKIKAENDLLKETESPTFYKTFLETPQSDNCEGIDFNTFNPVK